MSEHDGVDPKRMRTELQNAGVQLMSGKSPSISQSQGDGIQMDTTSAQDARVQTARLEAQINMLEMMNRQKDEQMQAMDQRWAEQWEEWKQEHAAMMSQQKELLSTLKTTASTTPAEGATAASAAPKLLTPEDIRIQQQAVRGSSQTNLHLTQVQKDKIWQFQLVDLASLYPTNRTIPQVNSLMIAEGPDKKYELKPFEKLKNITNWVQWYHCFTIYAVTLVEKYPNRGMELLTYMREIGELARSFAWPLVYNYDKQFRLNVQDDPSKYWGRMDPDLLTTHIVAKFNQTGESNTRLIGDISKVKKPNGRNCYNFNQGTCTFGKKCRFVHRCNICGAFNSHGANTCRRASSTSTKGRKIDVITTNNM